MNDHKSPKEELSEALWVALLCECESCGKVLPLDDIEHLQDVDTMQWADVAADRAFSLGWRSEDGTIQCDECVVKCPTPLPPSQQGSDA